MEQRTTTHRTMRHALAAAMAVAAFGLAGVGAIASTDEPVAAPSCRVNETDLLRAASAARQLEAERAELFEGSSRARFEDLRLAAEWARRLEVLTPGLMCGASATSS